MRGESWCFLCKVKTSNVDATRRHQATSAHKKKQTAFDEQFGQKPLFDAGKIDRRYG